MQCQKCNKLFKKSYTGSREKLCENCWKKAQQDRNIRGKIK